MNDRSADRDDAYAGMIDVGPMVASASVASFSWSKPQQIALKVFLATISGDEDLRQEAWLKVITTCSPDDEKAWKKAARRALDNKRTSKRKTQKRRAAKDVLIVAEAQHLGTSWPSKSEPAPRVRYRNFHQKEIDGKLSGPLYAGSFEEYGHGPTGGESADSFVLGPGAPIDDDTWELTVRLAALLPLDIDIERYVATMTPKEGEPPHNSAIALLSSLKRPPNTMFQPQTFSLLLRMYLAVFGHEWRDRVWVHLLEELKVWVRAAHMHATSLDPKSRIDGRTICERARLVSSRFTPDEIDALIENTSLEPGVTGKSLIPRAALAAVNTLRVREKLPPFELARSRPKRA